MTSYQVFLLIVFIAWPLVIAGVLYLMERLERYLQTPEEPAADER